MRKTILIAIAGLAACSGDKKAAGPTGPGQIKVDTVALIVRTENVSGKPGAGSHRYPKGTTVAYEYLPSSGYREAFVMLGDKAVGPTGQLVLSADTTVLYAGAKEAPSVTTQDQSLAQAASQVVVAQDKEAAVRKYLIGLGELYGATSLEEARRRAQAVSQSIFAGANFTDMQKVHEALAGKVFSSEIIGTSASYSGSVRGRVAVVLVNGMLNAKEDAAQKQMETIYLMREANLPFPLRVHLFYNGSWFKNIDLRTYCFFTLGLSCLTGGLADVTELANQLASSANRMSPEAVREAKQITEFIQNRRAEGWAVLCLGHSQGTLMCEQALKELGAPDRCVAAVALGGPGSSKNWNVTEGRLSGFAVKGDFVLRLGLNDFPQLETSLSREADRAVAAETQAILQALARLKWGWTLHGYIESYLAASESRARAKELIAKHASELANNPDCVVTRDSIFAVSGRASSFGPSDLWRVQTAPAGKDSLVGRVKTAGGKHEPVMTDIARQPNGELWGVSPDTLYRLEVGKDTVHAHPYAYFSSTYGSVNALAFDSTGMLFFADSRGNVAGADLATRTVFWRADISPYYSSGDLAFSPGGELFIVVRVSGLDRLATIDIPGKKIGKLCNVPIGFNNVWGLAFVGSRLFGVTADTSSGKGLLIEIDTAACVGKRVRQLAFSAFGAGSSQEKAVP